MRSWLNRGRSRRGRERDWTGHEAGGFILSRFFALCWHLKSILSLKVILSSFLIDFGSILAPKIDQNLIPNGIQKLIKFLLSFLIDFYMIFALKLDMFSALKDVKKLFNKLRLETIKSIKTIVFLIKNGHRAIYDDLKFAARS